MPGIQTRGLPVCVQPPRCNIGSTEGSFKVNGGALDQAHIRLSCGGCAGLCRRAPAAAWLLPPTGGCCCPAVAAAGCSMLLLPPPPLLLVRPCGSSSVITNAMRLATRAGGAAAQHRENEQQVRDTPHVSNSTHTHAMPTRVPAVSESAQPDPTTPALTECARPKAVLSQHPRQTGECQAIGSGRLGRQRRPPEPQQHAQRSPLGHRHGV